MIEIGTLDDFLPNTTVVTEVNGREVVVARWGDQLYALNNDCPHRGGPLCGGHLGPRIESTGSGSIELDPSRPTLACSWHGWEFDLASGSALWDPAYRVRTYPLEVTDDGRVLLQPKRQRRDRGER
jgi:nitrite reductase (NADH) small subunit